ncbi:unnamed protein product [Mytilus coruscus]|uniref:Uncharacterized protein n=1 Tax=Mytilus coruscus TaxID=42192 RepID=A0A6J8BZZ8_MYTCO|nr:unnamed protein product [Mytilus coruscus]
MLTERVLQIEAHLESERKKVEEYRRICEEARDEKENIKKEKVCRHLEKEHLMNFHHFTSNHAVIVMLSLQSKIMVNLKYINPGKCLPPLYEDSKNLEVAMVQEEEEVYEDAMEYVQHGEEKEYCHVFKHIVILCPTIQWNKAYKNREWIGDVRKPKTKNLIIVNPIVEVREANGSLYEEEKLQELLRMFFKKYAGHPTLYIIDDCSATKELTKKKDMLSELAFSGRHAEQSVWVISQRYNSVLKDLREQTKWLCMFYTKDRDSFDNCLRENDVIPTLEERQRIKEELKKKKHRKLILKTDQPTDYWLID